MGTKVDIWFPTYIGELFTVASAMTGHEVGAYQLIIAKLWKEGGAIAADERQLAKLARASPRQWKEMKETLWPLFEIKGGLLTHSRTSEEIAKAMELSEKKRGAAVARWSSERKAHAMRVHSECNAAGVPRADSGDDPNQASGYRGEIGKKPFRVVNGGGQ
jgi:uncharacterized protein YdaU (DUF1376 family)